MAFALAYLLRFEFHVPPREVPNALGQWPLALLIQLSALHLMGVYAFVWRYVGLAEAAVFWRAAAITSSLLVVLRFSLPDALAVFRVPLSVIVMDSVLGFGGVLGLRVARRVLFEATARRDREAARPNGLRRPVLLIGAGRAGVLAVRELRGRGDTDLQIKGFVDDDPLKQGAVICGVRVLGTTQDLPRLVRDHVIDHVVITVAEAPPEALRRLVEACEAIPVRVRSTPGLYEVLQGKVSISRFRDVRVEDLLERDLVHLDEGDLERFLTGKVVMVTGAGGSIGSELARQVAHFAPSRLLLVERAEFALFDVDRELRHRWPALPIVPVLADVGDRDRMGGVFAAHRPQVIAHAAAHKHVPLVEQNAGEAIKNNVFGTLTLGDLAGRHGAEAFVMISTDKAVRPSSVMGASKRVAELIVQDLGRRYATRFVAVRFGNVLGSTGSVIPIFREQIARGGPVTITHPDMKRYFMTIPEAAVLVLEAGAMGEGGEIFVLDMGEPVRILDLAKRMIELSGHEPFKDVDIAFTGVRPGEKLFEELQTRDEAIAKTRHPKIYIGKIEGVASKDLEAGLARLRSACGDGQDNDELRACLAELLPESQLNGAAPANVARS